jgi:ribosomal protein L15
VPSGDPQYGGRGEAGMKERQGVWFATGSEIIDAYQSTV